MKRFVRFILKGLPLSAPLGALALAGLGGGGVGPVFAWIGIAFGLPWNIPALAVGLGTVLSNQGLLGSWSIQIAVIWACISLSVNCSFLVALLQRVFDKASSNVSSNGG
jgi:hypothetical protein